MFVRRGLFAAMALAFSGCSTTISVGRYDRSCTADADCVLAYSGEVCDQHCSCGGNVAINVSQQAEYEAELNALRASCPPRFGSGVMCGACTPPHAACVAHVCQAVAN